MIDFHTHILPNIDDGSKNIEETFSLIKEAEKAGFDKIISTSHYFEGFYESSHIDREAWIEALNTKISEQNINVKLYLGSEIYISDNIVNLLESNKASSINKTRYVLFEMPLNAKPLNLYDMIFELIRHKYIPILAHPERYTFVQKDTELIYDLIQNGVLMQSNFGSFIGFYGTEIQKTAKELLQRNMIHFLGSDVHRQNTLYQKIPETLKTLKKYISSEKIEELTETNPSLVLENKEIEIYEPKIRKKSIFDIFNSKT